MGKNQVESKMTGGPYWTPSYNTCSGRGESGEMGKFPSNLPRQLVKKDRDCGQFETATIFSFEEEEKT